MIRKLAAVCLIITILVLAGCGGKETDKSGELKANDTLKSQDAAFPESDEVKATADKILKLIDAGEWATVYDFVYTDIQKTISKEDFVNLKKQELANSKMEYRNYKVNEPRMISEWVDKIDGITYQNVVEVPYVVDVKTQRGDIEVKNNMYLLNTPDKGWRYLWIKK